MKTKRVPRFRDETQEAEYWDRESVTDHLDEFTSVAAEVARPLGHVLSIRLTTEDMRKLEELARSQGIGSSTMVRMLIRQVLEEAARGPSAPRSSGAETQTPVLEDLRQRVIALELLTADILAKKRA